MRCYYSFVATKKVYSFESIHLESFQLPLSPDQLSEAERHVDEETISRLKQISADSFAKIVQGKVCLGKKFINDKSKKVCVEFESSLKYV